MYGYARVSVREPEDKNLDLQVERLTHVVPAAVPSFPRKRGLVVRNLCNDGLIGTGPLP